MKDNQHVIGAFADNEPVDPAELKEALASAEGREYLVDLLVLRGFVRGDGGGKSSLSVVQPAPAPGRIRWLFAAAAVAALSLAGGYYAGRQSAMTRVTDTTAVTASAPEPTRVISLENSADWTERVSEN